eukprot:1885406-Pleurochrysis_carterae.AAC.2
MRASARACRFMPTMTRLLHVALSQTSRGSQCRRESHPTAWIRRRERPPQPSKRLPWRRFASLGSSCASTTLQPSSRCRLRSSP